MLRCHLQAFHKPRYIKWYNSNDFISKLPNDIKLQKENIEKKGWQTMLDPHMKEKEQVIPYLDELFNEVACHWLIATDQLLQALQHPSFKEIIDVVAHTTKGIKIDNLRSTCERILREFKCNVTTLSKRLNSTAVKGKINLTCNTWQAENTDSYFAVTSHWVKEAQACDSGTHMEWTVKSSLFGFISTQAFIKAYSKSGYYNPAYPDDELVAVSSKQRDVIGLVHVITVKTRSSSMCKQLFLDLQAKKDTKPL
ncbi:hypothetical protein GSI_07146 [Ganoderma sinense ZZ0214-1]|uniref:Uncharacterized protein n=1 Tax=Ganoderma sinense ZZ0214-1 TaxID=1077348 RepID=A0A2G8S9L4_9APHY|nr:hypothetical protein GSI_07146 [Ganoderma sinense ZZ0214-1]